MNARRIIWIVGLLLASSGLWGQEFSAFVDKREVPLGEVFKLTFQLVNGKGGQLAMPDLDDFQLRGGPDQGTSVQMVNGRVTEIRSISYYLQGTRTGNFTIGPATISTPEGDDLKSEPITIRIVDARSSNGSGQTGSNGGSNQRNANIEAQLENSVFLRALPSKRSVYQGEPLTVTYKLYERVATGELSPISTPGYEGFWVENVDLRNPTPKIEVYEGVRYRTYVIRQDVLFPQRNGSLTIDPFQISTVVRIEIPPEPGRQRSIFDQLIRQYDNYQYRFASNAINVEVKPLPTSAPGRFSGLVGDFGLTSTLDTNSVEAGEPLTFTLRIEGEGNFKKLQEPQLDFPPDFEVYDPTMTESIRLSGGTLKGWRNYEYLIIPRNPGEYTLPSVELDYFDLGSKRYQSLRTEAFEVEVTGDPIVLADNGSGERTGAEPSILNQDIRFISVGDPGLRAKDSSLLSNWWYWLLLLLPIAGTAVLYLSRKQQAESRRDVAGTRRRKAAKVAQKRLKVAEEFLKAGKSKEFYDELVRATWGYLGDKFSLRPSELNREKAAQVLASKGAPEPLTQQLNQLIDTCEMALYAPSAAPGGMQGTYETASKLITDLEEL